MSSVSHKEFPLWGKWLIYIIIVIASIALIWSQLPRGAYSTDLTRIGKGNPTFIVVYEASDLGGANVMKLLKDLRGEYSDRVEFLSADLGTPEGRSFARHYKAKSGTVVTFLGDGTRVRTIHQPSTIDTVRKVVEEIVPRYIQ